MCFLAKRLDVSLREQHGSKPIARSGSTKPTLSITVALTADCIP
jgi:delta8-fatty-acid desaturase